MKSLYVTMLVVVLVCFLCGTALACEDDPGLNLQVKYIGPVCGVGGSDWLFTELSKTPEKSLCALVKQLNTTSVKELHPGDWESNVDASSQVWRIRALRFLTCGQDFSSFTQYRPDKARDPEDYWSHLAGGALRNKKPGDQVEVLFFHTRMAWAIDYIAPIEAQKDIIRQWREWLVKNGTNAGCRPNATDYNQWWF